GGRVGAADDAAGEHASDGKIARVNGAPPHLLPGVGARLRLADHAIRHRPRVRGRAGSTPLTISALASPLEASGSARTAPSPLKGRGMRVTLAPEGREERVRGERTPRPRPRIRRPRRRRP